MLKNIAFIILGVVGIMWVMNMRKNGNGNGNGSENETLEEFMPQNIIGLLEFLRTEEGITCQEKKDALQYHIDNTGTWEFKKRHRLIAEQMKLDC